MNRTDGMKRKFVFLYLDTGAGHKAAARVLSNAIWKQVPDADIELVNGFDRKNYFGRIGFEKCYNFACNYIHGLFPLIYDLGQTRVFQDFLIHILYRHTAKYIRRLFLDKHVTDVVSFHFALTPFANAVLPDIPWQVNLTTVVTDPFTAPLSWFHESGTRFFVYSQQVKAIALGCGVQEKDITVVPFLLNEKYREPPLTPDEIHALKIKHGFDPDKKIVLLVGGGEGLPGAVEIINECILHRAKFSVAMVCGRDRPFKRTLDILAATYPRFKLHVFGFIDYLDELVKICDCAVIKAGPAVLMEALSCRKPIIIIKYIHNQELGNMSYAVEHNVGYYIRRPRRIYRKIQALLDDAEFEEQMRKNFDAINLDTDAGKVASLLLGM